MVRDASARWEALARSPMADLVRPLLTPGLPAGTEWDQLRAADEFLAKQLGVTTSQLRDDVFGQAVVYTYEAGPPGKPDAEVGTLLVCPRKPELVRAVYAKLNELQTKGGELGKVEARAHEGRPYSVRHHANKTSADYFAERDGVFAVSGEERAVQNFLARTPQEPGRGVAARLAELKLTERLAVVLFSPRRFDQALSEAEAGAANPAEAAFRKQFHRLWRGASAVAAFADVGDGLELGFVAAVKPDNAPEELRPLFAPPAPSRLATVVPGGAIVSVQGRLAAKPLLAAVQSFLPADAKPTLLQSVRDAAGPAVGTDKFDALLADLGPEWAFWADQPEAGGTLPAWTFALQLGCAGEKGAKPESVAALRQGVGFVMNLARYEYNRTHKEQVDLSESRGVVSLASPAGKALGMTPSVAVREGHLVIASSPARVEAFRAPTGDPVVAVPLRLNAAPLRKLLREKRAGLVELAASASGQPAKAVGVEFDGLLAALEALDHVTLTDATTAGSVGYTLRVRFVQPLRPAASKK